MTAMALDDYEDWKSDALDVILDLALTGEWFSADELRQRMRPAPHPNLVGSVFAEARGLGLIKKTQPKCSTTASRNGSLLWQWVWVAT